MLQKAIRASSGAILNVPFHRFGTNEEEAVVKLSEELRVAASKAIQIVGTFVTDQKQENDVIPYWELQWELPTVLILGNEGSGLHPVIKDCCSHRITIPHAKAVESLNVAASSVPLLLERYRAKMTSKRDEQSE